MTVFCDNYGCMFIDECGFCDCDNLSIVGGVCERSCHIEDKSRWHELFGSPERAARTLEEFELDQLNWCRGMDRCEECPYEFDRYGCYLPDGFSLLEWLEGDAE